MTTLCCLFSTFYLAKVAFPPICRRLLSILPASCSTTRKEDLLTARVGVIAASSTVRARHVCHFVELKRANQTKQLRPTHPPVAGCLCNPGIPWFEYGNEMEYGQSPAEFTRQFDGETACHEHRSWTVMYACDNPVHCADAHIHAMALHSSCLHALSHISLSCLFTTLFFHHATTRLVYPVRCVLGGHMQRLPQLWRRRRRGPGFWALALGKTCMVRHRDNWSTLRRSWTPAHTPPTHQRQRPLTTISTAPRQAGRIRHRAYFQPLEIVV